MKKHAAPNHPRETNQEAGKQEPPPPLPVAWCSYSRQKGEEDQTRRKSLARKRQSTQENLTPDPLRVSPTLSTGQRGMLRNTHRMAQQFASNTAGRRNQSTAPNPTSRDFPREEPRHQTHAARHRRNAAARSIVFPNVYNQTRSSYLCLR